MEANVRTRASFDKLFHVEHTTQASDREKAIAAVLANVPCLSKRARDKASRLWIGAKIRARKANVPFSLSQSWVEQRLADGKCQITGIPFERPAGKSRSLFSASIDRKEPERGYTDDNCQLVVWIYNCAKSNGKHEDVMRMARALVSS